MPQTSFALMTTLGRAKEAAALANATTITITQIAIGDGATVPSGGETALYHEVARKTISGHGTVVGADNVAYFDCYLAAGDGPYTIREAGLYDDTGSLIAIAHYDPPINKPVPSSGQTVDATVRLEVAFSNVSSIVIVIDPSMKVALQRLTRLPWIPINELSRNDPPAAPTPGDVYVIGGAPTGAWAGQAGKVAEFTIAGWAILDPRDGHAVSLPDRRVFMRTAGAYSEFLATETLAALSRKASLAEVDAAVDVNAYIGPGVLAKALETHRAQILADVAWPTSTFQIINWNDYASLPSFATFAGGTYTLTRKGTYLLVAQLAHDCPNASSINIYWKKAADPSAKLVSSNSQATSGTANNALSVSYVLPGTDVSVGDTIDVRAYLGNPGGPYHVDKQTTPGMPTSFSISRIGN